MRSGMWFGGLARPGDISDRRIRSVVDFGAGLRSRGPEWAVREPTSFTPIRDPAEIDNLGRQCLDFTIPPDGHLPAALSAYAVRPCGI
jgi:hypothetical protein